MWVGDLKIGFHNRQLPKNLDPSTNNPSARIIFATENFLICSGGKPATECITVYGLCGLGNLQIGFLSAARTEFTKILLLRPGLLLQML